MRVLFMCTANSCRSILSGSHVQPPGPAGFRGMQRRQPAQRAGASAQPGDLEQAGIATHGLYSKGSEAFEGAPPDIVITVCDAAAGKPARCISAQR